MARVPLRAGDPVRISHYQLTARLGSGGMGVVYLGVAWDGSQVAVKVLRPELAENPEFRARFSREVTTLTRVKGMCTVRVIEADTQAPRPFLVTEYIDGPSLADYIEEQGALGAEMLYGLATGLAEALAAIHATGVIHRDLKPSNVLLTAGGPKVIDFGIAQRDRAVRHRCVRRHLLPDHEHRTGHRRDAGLAAALDRGRPGQGAAEPAHRG